MTQLENNYHLSISTYQCDQIGRNFATSAKLQKSLTIFASLLVFGEILNILWLIIEAFGQISLLTMAKYWINDTAIRSHWSLFRSACLSELRGLHSQSLSWKLSLSRFNSSIHRTQVLINILEVRGHHLSLGFAQCEDAVHCLPKGQLLCSKVELEEENFFI